MNRSQTLRNRTAQLLVNGVILHLLAGSIAVLAREPSNSAEGAAAVAGATAVETNVKTALRMNTRLTKPEAIVVQDRDGTITLTGSVPDGEQARIALEVARSVAGVRSVINKLVIGTIGGQGGTASPTASQTRHNPRA